jgi:hypothetical protein
MMRKQIENFAAMMDVPLLNALQSSELQHDPEHDLSSAILISSLHVAAASGQYFSSQPLSTTFLPSFWV